MKNSIGRRPSPRNESEKKNENNNADLISIQRAAFLSTAGIFGKQTSVALRLSGFRRGYGDATTRQRRMLTPSTIYVVIND